MLAVQGQVMQQLFRLHEQVVEPVDFWRGVGQPSTLTHHRVKAVVMVGVEREEKRDDRVPGVSRDSTHEIAAHFALGTLVRRHVDVGWFTIECRGDRRRIENAHVPGEPGNDEVLVHGCNGPRGHGAACVHQQFQPFAEALRVETLVVAWSSAPPQIEVEDRRQLRWCRRGDDLCTDIESAVPDELMQRLWRKVRHDSREVWRVQQAREGISEEVRCRPVWTRAGFASRRRPTDAFRHELAMIRVLWLKKQS